MQNSSEVKSISVIVKLDEFAAINGDLPKINTDIERQKYIHKFFSERYGPGDGKLEIIQRQAKVKLNWIANSYDPKAELLHKSALSHAKNKNYSEAISNWVKALSINPKDPDYYFNLGIAFFEIKNYRESIENLNRTISICPIYHKAHLILGTVLLKVRHFNEAEKHLKESINFNPYHGLSHLNLGAVYSILKRYDDGIAMFMKALKLVPNEPRAYFGLGKIYSIKGDIGRANQYFSKVIELDKNSDLANHAKRALQMVPGPAQMNVAPSVTTPNVETLYQEGYKAFLFTDYERALKMYQAYLSQKPDDDFVWFALGEACLRLGLLDKSKDSYKTAIKLNPSKAVYHKELAVVCYYQQNSDELINSVERALKLGKTDSMTSALHGYGLIKKEKYQEAIQHLQEALRLDFNNLFSKFYLAYACLKNGDRNTAVNLLQELQQSRTKSPLISEAQKLANNTL